MFSIFSMRRPNILPVGECNGGCRYCLLTSYQADMGVQRGVLRWFLSLYSPSYKVTFMPCETESPGEKTAASTPETKKQGRGKKAEATAEQDSLPVFGQASTSQPEGISEDVSSVPPAPASETPINDIEDSTPAEIASTPASITPSTNETPNQKGSKLPPPLPAGMTVATLKSRLDPKKRSKK